MYLIIVEEAKPTVLPHSTFLLEVAWRHRSRDVIGHV